MPVAAIGSLLVMVGLIAGLGYGGWMVLQNIQRVNFAPVEELPVAVAEIDPLGAPDAASMAEPGYTDLAEPVTATALAELYRQQELEVPILAPRDGPIAALDPDTVGLLARPSASADAMRGRRRGAGRAGRGGVDPARWSPRPPPPRRRRR